MLPSLKGSESEVAIEIGSFASFADYFFDGLIADWIVQSRISSSLDRAVRMQRNVQATMARLDWMRQEAQEKASNVEEERRALIEGA